MNGLSIEEKKNLAVSYSCELLLENASLEQMNDKSYPSDAYIIYYVVDNVLRKDLTRGKKVNLFDFYYDTYGPGSVQRIDFGYGRSNPRLWGNKKPSGKKGEK
jgi:hypothetical protein